MNDIIDKFLIRLFVVIIFIFFLYLYKYLHILFYPSEKKHFLKKFIVVENPADTIHLFSRILGLSIIFSSQTINEYNGFYLATFNLISWLTISSLLFVVSIYITESIVFYNFDYKDEVLKKQNISYALISASLTISLSWLIKTILLHNDDSFIISIIMWLLIIVIFNFSLKLFGTISGLIFNKLLIQKNLSLGSGFSGFSFSMAIIISSAFTQNFISLPHYLAQLFLKILLSLLIFPLVDFGICHLIQLKQIDKDPSNEIGHGIYLGFKFLIAAYITSITIGQINFGSIYPYF
jgi:hypothetical protein